MYSSQQYKAYIPLDGCDHSWACSLAAFAFTPYTGKNNSCHVESGKQPRVYLLNAAAEILLKFQGRTTRWQLSASLRESMGLPEEVIERQTSLTDGAALQASDPDSFLSASAAVMMTSAAASRPHAMLARQSSVVTDDSKDSTAKLVRWMQVLHFWTKIYLFTEERPLLLCARGRRSLTVFAVMHCSCACLIPASHVWCAAVVQ